MKCDNCKVQIEDGEERDHAGQTLCEDCYMDTLFSVKTCDPWAVYTAKSMSGSECALTKRQEEILAVLKETNGIEFEPLARRLGLEWSELQREIATLRHMEKLSAVMNGDKKLFRLWQ